MALDIDQPNIYDPIVKTGTSHLSDIWVGWFSSFYQTLIGYLSQNGIFIPILTTVERDAIQSAQEGQIIYNSDFNGIEFYNGNSWGFMVPQLTTVQRDAIQIPQEGQIIYNSDNQTIQSYLNGAWRQSLSPYSLYAPQLTTAQRDALTGVVNGQIIYNTTTDKFQGREAGAWVNLI